MVLFRHAIPWISGQGPQQGPTWETKNFPSLESDPGDGFGATVALFSYLTQIWLETITPTSGETLDFGEVSGSGSQLMMPTSVGPTSGGVNTLDFIRAAYLDILAPIPPNIDEVFGTPGIYQFGYCGFGYQTNTQLSRAIGTALMILQNVSSPVQCARLQWVNQLSGIFYPDNKTLNTFWWNLKPGVKAHLRMVQFDPGFGASAWPTENIAQTFNPLGGGWCPFVPNPFGAVFDSGGQPACGGE